MRWCPKKRKYVLSLGIYFDTSSKGAVAGSARGKRHHCYRAGIMVEGRRIRKRFATYAEAYKWLQCQREVEKNYFS